MKPDASVLFEEIPVVEAASLHTQTLEEAPANVTVITDEDIRKYGYRTLGEALSSARGFYSVYDRTYHYVGLRGFLTPGDNNTRFLVMINGHYMTESIYSSNNYFGQDFGLDMDLVKRIEIIRGVGSALYGTNGIFCTVNVVTKSPIEHPLARVSTETGSFGERKVQVSSAVDLGRGANLLSSLSVFNNAGQSLYFPEFDAPQSHGGRAEEVDGERGYHGFVNLVWRNWAVTGLLASREKNVPFVPWSPSLFASRGTKILDQRSFLEISYHRSLKAGELGWRLYYDHYRFWGRYDREGEEGISDTRDQARGNWAGTQLTYTLPPGRFGTFTLGMEAAGDVNAVQRQDMVSPKAELLFYVDTPRRSFAIFAQDELALTTRWKAYLGARFDEDFRHRGFVSPRLAVVFQQSPLTVWKFLYGRAFRNPSLYETYYVDADGAQIANPGLQPESAHSFEAALERKLGRRLNAVVSAYVVRMSDYIQSEFLPDDRFQYRNRDVYLAMGVEAEVSGRIGKGLEGGANFAWQRMRDLTGSDPIPNSPARMGKLRLAIPLFRKRIWLSGSGSWLSSRSTSGEATLPGVQLAGATLTTQRLTTNCDLQFGVRNLFDRKYYDPAAGPAVLDRVLADGRSVYLKLIWHSRE